MEGTPTAQYASARLVPSAKRHTAKKWRTSKRQDHEVGHAVKRRPDNDGGSTAHEAIRRADSTLPTYDELAYSVEPIDPARLERACRENPTGPYRAAVELTIMVQAAAATRDVNLSETLTAAANTAHLRLLATYPDLEPWFGGRGVGDSTGGHSREKIPDEKVEAMKRMYAVCKNKAEVARFFDVSRKTVGRYIP